MCDYWCKHDIYSVLLQGICDGEMIFENVCVRAQGGTRNVAHLRQHSFYIQLMRKQIFQEHVVTIGGQQILMFVAGDLLILF